MSDKLTCDKCNGTGKINGYNHIHDGICFKCNGTGKVNGNKKSQKFNYVGWISEEVDFYGRLSDLENSGIITTVNGIKMIEGPKGGKLEFNKYFKAHYENGKISKWVMIKNNQTYTVYNQ